MKKLVGRLVCLLLAMTMCLSLVGPALAEDLSGQDDSPMTIQVEFTGSGSSGQNDPEQGSDNDQNSNEEQCSDNNQNSNEEQGSDNEQNSNEEQGSDNEQNSNEEQGSDNEQNSNEEQGSDNDQNSNEEQNSDNEQNSNEEQNSDNEQQSQGEESEPPAEEPVELPAAPKLNQTSLSMTTLGTAQLSLTNATAASFVSDNEQVATVNRRGVVTARHVGKAVISATDTSGQSVSCTVTVRSTTKKTSAVLSVGKKSTLVLKDRTLYSAVSSNTKIATVTAKGTVTALRSGIVNITLTDTLGDLHVCTLTVRGVLKTKRVTVSETKNLQLKITGSKIKNARSSNSRVVKVSSNGKLTGVRAGKATITLTDNSGSTATCKVTVKPNYLARTAAGATRAYNKVVALRCRHVTGVHTYSQMVRRRQCTCTTPASISLQTSGVLKPTDWITHTKAGSISAKLRNPSRAIHNLRKLRKGTYTLYKANCTYDRLPKKYKAAGMVYIQDSNICVSAGKGYIYSCNEASSQYRHGHYYNTKVSSGYTHHNKILYVIAPNE